MHVDTTSAFNVNHSCYMHQITWTVSQNVLANHINKVSSVLWCCWLGGRKGIWHVKTEWWGTVWSEVQMICTWSSWCHCHPIISCSSKIQNGLPFWCRLTQVVLEKGCQTDVVVVVNHVNEHSFQSMRSKCPPPACTHDLRQSSHWSVAALVMSWSKPNQVCLEHFHRSSMSESSFHKRIAV